MSEPNQASGPDLTRGVPLADVPDGGFLLGQVEGQPVLLLRRGEAFYAVGANCTHYGGPLQDGLAVDCELSCPWHQARYDIRTGEVVGPPAARSLPTWHVVREGARVRVGAKRPDPAPKPRRDGPASVVIVGAGAAGDAAAAALRHEGYAGPITLIGRDAEPLPVDRPNLSKDFLAGLIPEDALPIRDASFYAERDIRLVTGAEVTALEPRARRVTLADGRALDYGALLLATGASPIRLDIPGAGLPHVFTLRTLGDSRAIAARAAAGGAAVVVGASFIALEAAASLRHRGMTAHVVAPDARPLERVLGPEMGDAIRALHEQHGVVFHLGRKPATISPTEVTLDDGSRLPASLVVMGVGVRPNTALAEAAGLRVDRGVLVDAALRTSAEGVWAAGDIARFPAGGGSWRIEHWTVAQQQGRAAARNMLGDAEPYRAVPFFWSQHYELAINYVGHAESWDRIEVAGDLAAQNATVAYWSGGRITALVTVYRDHDSLLATEAFARGDQAALERLLATARV